MKKLNKLFVALTLGALVLTTASVGWAQAAVELDRVNGLDSSGVLATGQEITFALRLTNNTGQVAIGITQGFRVYSPDGALWYSTRIDTTSALGRSIFPMGLYLRDFSITGSGADTVGFLGVGENIGLPSGLPVDYDDVGLAVTIGPISEDYRGKTICLDSSFFFNGGNWQWVLQEPTEIIPSWSGPHCYTIRCCNYVGDVNDLGEPSPDIGDLVYLVNYMFNDGPPPPCERAADVNGSGGIPDISDLIYLLNFMFHDGPDLVPCH
ncbi:MAG: hypothetical protein ABIE70_02320 [bacterium]